MMRSQRTPSRERSSTAYHEAGHAVAAWVLGLPLHTVSIAREGDRAGFVALKWTNQTQRIGRVIDQALAGRRPSAVMRERIERRLVMLHAGGEAERQYRGRYHHVGAHKDRAHAIELTEALSANGAEAEAYNNWLLERARTLITAHWSRIEAVAALLLERETVTGADIHATIVAADARAIWGAE